MRKVLCRGKTQHGWEYGSLIQLDADSGFVYICRMCEQASTLSPMQLIQLGTYHVDPSTVGMNSGVTDKNQQEIFEGDIVLGMFSFGMAVKGVCGFQNGSFGLFWQRGLVGEFTAFTSTCHIEWEVIGNIHDNPELLNEQDARS